MLTPHTLNPQFAHIYHNFTEKKKAIIISKGRINHGVSPVPSSSLHEQSQNQILDFYSDANQIPLQSCYLAFLTWRTLSQNHYCQFTNKGSENQRGLNWITQESTENWTT